MKEKPNTALEAAASDDAGCAGLIGLTQWHVRVAGFMAGARWARSHALEEAAEICERSDRHRGDYFAQAIRAAKEEK